MSDLNRVGVGDLNLAYRELGSGPPVLLLHGWPTSSYLWREVMRPIAETNRAIAVDLPAFGASSKPPQASYDFGFFSDVIDGFLSQLGIERVGLVGHDIGGPIATKWALDHLERVSAIALLNTLVYPDFSEAVEQFINACRTPELRAQLTSPEGLAAVMKLGVGDPKTLSEEVTAAVAEPFRSEADRDTLAAAGVGLEPEVFDEIARRLPSLDVPARLIYGAQDRILPDIAETMARLSKDLPHAELTELADCGHFLQEEQPQRVGDLLRAFFSQHG